MSSTTSTYFCALTIRKHLLKVDFERRGRGQEPSRGHKFSILENVVLHWDFTSQTLASFLSDLVGVALVGARPLHLACARPLCRLKAPLGLLLPRLRWGRAVQVLLSAVIAKGKMSYKAKKTAAKSCLPCGAVKQSKSEPFPSDATSVASPKVTVCVPSL